MGKEKKELTTFCFSGGWAAKLEPGRLEEALNKQQTTTDNLLVAFANSDDASIYRLTDEQYLVATVDVITPIINDPYIFGQIAAANSLSDIFAMGAQVLYALNVCSFPKEMELDSVNKIIQGALSKMTEIKAPIAGGHTISEPSLLFGLSVTGLIEDGKYFANDMALANQSLILTKPLGIGIYSVAYQNKLLNEQAYQDWIKTMTTLNYQASQIARKYITTMTDITGFGLLGHAYEIAKASNITMEIEFAKIEFLTGVVEYAKKGYLTGASYNNYEYLKDKIISNYEETINLLLCDPQTSGGLLLLVAKDKEQNLIKELKDNNIEAYVIGQTLEKQEQSIIVK